jgi:hypothetical protein
MTHDPEFQRFISDVKANGTDGTSLLLRVDKVRYTGPKTGVPFSGTVGSNPTSSASGTISITFTTRPAHLVGHPEKLSHR